MDLAKHLHRVTDLKVVADHKLLLSFDDGLTGVLDAASWDWRGVFAPLQEPSYFARASLDEELGAITWPNGADVAPETLHLWLTEQRDRQPA